METIKNNLAGIMTIWSLMTITFVILAMENYFKGGDNDDFEK